MREKKIIIHRIFKGSPVFTAYREGNEKLEGFGESPREALNDLLAWERYGNPVRIESYKVAKS